jgi:hypothetical protein
VDRQVVGLVALDDLLRLLFVYLPRGISGAEPETKMALLK